MVLRLGRTLTVYSIIVKLNMKFVMMVKSLMLVVMIIYLVASYSLVSRGLYNTLKSSTTKLSSLLLEEVKVIFIYAF